MHGPISNGTRVLVQWSDGRSYRGVAGASHNGYFHVRWDAGGYAWVPAAYVRAEAAVPAAQAPAAAQPAAQPAAQQAAQAAAPAAAQQAAPSAAQQAAQSAAQQAAPAAAQVQQPAAAQQQAGAQPMPLAAAMASYPAAAWEWQPPPPPAAAATGRAASSPAVIATPPSRLAAQPAARHPSASIDPPESDTVPNPKARISQSFGVKPMQGAAAGDLPRGIVYEPTGQANAKAFFIFFGYVSLLETDLELRMAEIDRLADAVTSLRAAGFRVVIDLLGDRAGLELALRSEHPDAGGAASAGVQWSSHGHDDGSIDDHEGRRIAPEDLPAATPLTIAQRGTLRLFALSARSLSTQGERWHSALGPQVEICSLEAAHERAAESEAQGNASPQELVELLGMYLDIPRASAQGPLAELKELAESHAARLASIRLTHEELVNRAAEWLKAEVQPGKRRETYVTIAVVHRSKGARPDPSAAQQPRLQTVRVTPRGAQDQSVHLMSIVGPYSEALDLPRALRELVDAMRTRLAIVKLSPQEPEFVVAEAFILRRGLDPITLGKTIAQVGYVADRLEALFFGVDQY